MKKSKPPAAGKLDRRDAIRTLFGMAAALTTAGCQRNVGSMRSFFRKNFREMGKEELAATLERLERRYGRQFGRRVSVRATPPQKGVVFGYALDVSRCIGCRRCVYACVDENNQSRNPQVHWIQVLQMGKAKGLDLLDLTPIMIRSWCRSTENSIFLCSANSARIRPASRSALLGLPGRIRVGM